MLLLAEGCLIFVTDLAKLIIELSLCCHRLGNLLPKQTPGEINLPNSSCVRESLLATRS